MSEMNSCFNLCTGRSRQYERKPIMITCRIMNGEDTAPAYTEGTKHLAYVPNAEEVRLLTTVDIESIMEVLIDDYVVETRSLKPGRHYLNLALFLARGARDVASRQSRDTPTIWSRFRSSEPATPEPTKEFTIRYKNANTDGDVVATFEFQFLDSVAFKLSKMAHTVLHDHKAHESEADPNAKTWICWDCDGTVPAHRTTCNNCGAPRNHPSNLKRRGI